MAHLTTDHADKSRWVCLYPIFINGEKTIAEGRRIPKEKAVSNPSPSFPEIGQALNQLRMTAIAEAKWHPRDFEVVGRARIQLKNSDGSLVNPNIANRQQLFEAVAAKIKVMDRTFLPRNETKRLTMPEILPTTTGSSGSGTAVTSGGTGSTGSSKKKGKKGRK